MLCGPFPVYRLPSTVYRLLSFGTARESCGGGTRGTHVACPTDSVGYTRAGAAASARAYGPTCRTSHTARFAATHSLSPASPIAWDHGHPAPEGGAGVAGDPCASGPAPGGA